MANDLPAPQSENKVRHASDITERLTITINGPEANDVDSEADGSGLGEIPTAEEALAIRPRLDDPTTLTNGNVHPRYVEWMTKYTWSERHPLNEYLSSQEHLRLLTDERGYFDRKRVNRALGPSGSKFWLADGPLPSKREDPTAGATPRSSGRRGPGCRGPGTISPSGVPIGCEPLPISPIQAAHL